MFLETEAIRFLASYPCMALREILESNRAGRGMMLFMNGAQQQADPIHHALFLQMNPGMHVRIWIPAKYEHTAYDVVEDFWLIERLEQLASREECLDAVLKIIKEENSK